LITEGQANTPVLVANVWTDCGAKITSLTFATNPTASLALFSGLAVYQNGVALSGTWNAGTFTFASPVILNPGATTMFTLEGTVPSNDTSSTVQFSLTTLAAQALQGNSITQTYPAVVTGNNLSYHFVFVPQFHPI
jgi:hypothetical protein